jgi:predicted transposase YbfD/YdcC
VRSPSRQGYVKVVGLDGDQEKGPKEESKRAISCYHGKITTSQEARKDSFMDYNTFEEAIEQGQWPMKMDEMSVYHAFEQVQDGRKKRGVRYALSDILMLLLLGKLVGMKTPAAIAQWVRLRAVPLKKILAWQRDEFPCASTYSNVLRTLDSHQLNEVLAHLLTRAEAEKRWEEEPSRLVGDAQAQIHVHLALDGKTLRGTLGHAAPEEQKMHQLGLYETHTGVLLKEQVVGDKENELSIVSQFLTPILVKGRVITADALHTQRIFCWMVTRWEGDYVLIAKKNQPMLHEDLSLFFTEPPLDCRDWRTDYTVDAKHGRLERRELIASTELNEFLGRDWAQIAQVFQLRRIVQEKGETRIETVYGFTSLSPAQASPLRLLTLVRDHWAIENRLHWRRDVTLGEDHCQVRKGNTPRALAILNSFLLALLDFQGVKNVPHHMRMLDARPWLAVQLLFGSLLTFT